MSPLTRGGAPVTGCYRGTLAVSAIYRGVTLVWSKDGSVSATVNFASSLAGSQITSLSFGSCISTFSGDGQNVNIIKGSTADSTAWRNTLGELGPVAWRIPLAWNGGSPGSGAGGARSSGDAADYIRAIKNIGGTPIVAVSGTTNDNDILAADAANLVKFFNDNGGQNGGPVTRWIIGNEPDNGFGMTNYISGGNGSDGFNTIVTAMRNASATPLSIAGPALVTYADYKEGDFNAFFDACGANVDVVDFHMYDGNDLPRYTAGMAWLRDAIASRPSMAGRVTIQVGEYNYASYYAEPDKGANQFWTSANTVAGASTIGRVLNHGGAAYQYSDNNGPLGMITPGNDLNGAPLGYRIPTPSYYGVKMWSGGNLFRRPTGSMASCVTTIPGVEVYASTGHKNIVVVNTNTTAVTDFTVAVQGVDPVGVADVWQTAPGTNPTDPTGPQWQDPTRIYSAGFTEGRIPLTLPAQTVTTVVLEPGGYQPTTVDVNPSVRSYATTSHNNGGTETAKPINRPRQVVAGDLLVLFAIADSGTLANNTTMRPSGFTELGRVVGSPGARIAVFYKVAVASDAGGTINYGSYPTGADGASLMLAVKNWSGSTAGLTYGGSTATNTTMNSPSVVPKTARSLLLNFIASDDDSATRTWGWIPPVSGGTVGYAHNIVPTTELAWSSGAVSQEIVTGTTATGVRTWSVNTASTQTTRLTASLTIPAGTATKTITQMLSEYTYTGGADGAKTDTIDNSFTDSDGVTSTYHLFAAGLDWTKNVGLMVYTDGSGEYGLLTSTINGPSEYLLDGPNGLINVAKRRNMVLLTPRAPGGPCDDGDGVCWYDHSAAVAGGSPARSPWEKMEWSNELIRWVMTRYNIDRRRMVISGYSSGAQWTTGWWGPKYGSEVMLDGLALAFSYGGQPRVQPKLTAAYKANVEHVWNVGTLDTSYTQPTWDDGVQTGRAWYVNNGFAVTDLQLVQGQDHERDVVVNGVETADFGEILEREIIARVIPA